MLQQATLRPGMRVEDSDGRDLGTVDQVYASPDGSSYRLVLANGAVRVPGDLVGSIRDDVVRLKLSADTVRSTQWGELPSDYAVVNTYELRGPVLDVGDTETIRRYEERLLVDKEFREVGQIQVRKRVVEEPQTLSVDVARELWDVEEVEVNRPWKQGDDTPYNEGDTIIVPIIGEKVEVIRRRVVTGELRLTKRTETVPRQITETVRKEIVEVEGPEEYIRRATPGGGPAI